MTKATQSPTPSSETFFVALSVFDRLLLQEHLNAVSTPTTGPILIPQVGLILCFSKLSPPPIFDEPQDQLTGPGMKADKGFKPVDGGSFKCMFSLHGF